MLYEAYDLARTTEMVIVKRSKNGKEQQVPIIRPTGFTLLPEMGGINNQSYFDIKIFAAFLRGERAAVKQMMKQK